MCSDRNVLNFLYKTIKYKIKDKSQQNNKWWYCLENFRVGDIISYPLLPYITNSPNLLMERIFILGFFAKVALHHLFPWHKCLKISPTEEFHLIETTWFHLFFMCWKYLLKIGANKGLRRLNRKTLGWWVGIWIMEFLNRLMDEWRGSIEWETMNIWMDELRTKSGEEHRVIKTADMRKTYRWAPTKSLPRQI